MFFTTRSASTSSSFQTSATALAPLSTALMKAVPASSAELGRNFPAPPSSVVPEATSRTIGNMELNVEKVPRSSHFSTESSSSSSPRGARPFTRSSSADCTVNIMKQNAASLTLPGIPSRPARVICSRNI